MRKLDPNARAGLAALAGHWRDLRGSQVFAKLATVAVCLLVAGCFRPLYGSSASGIPVQAQLASIEVISANTPRGQELLGHFVRSELIYNLNGSGVPAPKRYRLTLGASDAVQVTSTDAASGRADAAFVNASVTYELRAIDDNRQITAGTSKATITYFRDPQRFAALRAARDAEERAGKQIADEIRQRLAALFATAP